MGVEILSSREFEPTADPAVVFFLPIIRFAAASDARGHGLPSSYSPPRKIGDSEPKIWTCRLAYMTGLRDEGGALAPSGGLAGA
jgi:hypothetical protein